MTDEGLPQEVLREARRLMASGQVADEFARSDGTLGRPLAVSHPWGGTHSWLVPVTVGDRLIGYLQLNPRLELIRYSSFQRRPDSLEGVPEASEWLDPGRVLERAASVARSDEDLGRPVLTYDQYPDRLAWKVEARSAAGGVRNIMVTGSSAWEQVDLGDEIGGPPSGTEP